MKKIFLPGLAAGLAMLVADVALNFLSSAVFPFLTTEFNNTAIFRSWNDPLMSFYFAYPLVLGWALAWAWNKTKTLFPGSVGKRGVNFGLAYFLIAVIPGMLITYSSFQLSLLLVLTWLVSGLIGGIIAGLIFAKMNK